MGGSFKPAGAVQKAVQDQKKQENLQKLQSATTGPTLEEAKAKEVAEKTDEINSFLPKTVDSVFGTLTYEQFKEKFKDVYTQVRDKDHLVSGRVSASFVISGMRVTLRSLRLREKNALLTLMGNPSEDIVAFTKKDGRYRIALLALALVSLDNNTFPEVRLTPETWDEWISDTSVQQTMDFIADLDETLFSMIFLLYSDLVNAKQFALMENLKNQ